MNRHVLSLAAAIGVAATSASIDAAFAGRRVALVIGNSAYENTSPLPNPTRDARAMAAMFKKAGFDEVYEHYDKKIVDFRRVIREFVERATDADTAVVFYAGHGIEIGGTNYVLPVDARLASSLDAEDEAVTLDRLVQTVDGAKGLRLVILDACRDNPFIRKMKRHRSANVRTLTVERGMTEPATTGGDTLVFYAAKAGSVAKDGAGEHSPFTAALLNHLFVPGLDIRRAMGWVRDEVLKATGNTQEPHYYGSLGAGDISIIPGPVKPTLTAVADSPEASGDYTHAERIGTAGAWEAFLRKHETGFYSDLARQQLARLSAGGQGSATQPVMRPASNTPELVRLAQEELARVACYAGPVDGNMTPATRAAIKQYQTQRGQKPADIEISEGFISELRSQQSKVCPLVCPAGKVAEGEQCVAKAAPPAKPLVKPGTVVRQKNEDEDDRPARQRARPEPARSQPPRSPARREAVQSRPSAPSGVTVGPGGGIGIGAGF